MSCATAHEPRARALVANSPVIDLREFTVDPAEIGCPALALVGTGEGGEPQWQFEVLSDRVDGPVTSRLFTADEGADTHCQLGNLTLSNAVTMDWLEDTLGGR